MTFTSTVGSGWSTMGSGRVVAVGCGGGVAVGVGMMGTAVGVTASPGFSMMGVVLGERVAVGTMVGVGVGVSGISHESVEWQSLHLPRGWLAGRSPLWQALQFV